MEKRKVETGDFNPFPEKIERKDVTVHISMKVEADLLDAIRAKAKEQNLPYQTMMKQMLRKQLELTEHRLEGLDMSEMVDRLAAVEKHVRELKASGKYVGGRGSARTKLASRKGASLSARPSSTAAMLKGSKAKSKRNAG